MIDVKELRIGNYVRYAANTTIGMVNGIVQNVLVNDIPLIDRQIYPIPLTPEILVKCGFEKRNDNFKKEHFILKKWGKNDWLVVDCDDQDIYPSMPLVKYLHQFQNLYFALTGTELQIEFSKTEKV